MVGRVVNGSHFYPFAVALKHAPDGPLYVDALLMDDVELALLFSANRSYFLVDMEVPSAYIAFLRAILQDKTAAELYTMVGLQKAGKNLFYRDFLHHLAHSRDRFIIAPGIRGLVMSVFTLPSYPYVFKVIKDRIAASKDTDRDKVMRKYALVKHHDRAGRMTDILEYSDVAFPRSRFSPELLAELKHVAPSQVEEDGERIIVRHLYIERRMTPLNLYLEGADDAQRIHAVREYGDAIRELATVNIFAGDLLFKNFGVTRYRPRRLLRLRRDRIPGRLPVPADSRAPAGLRRDVGRRLVSGRAARRLSGGIRDVPADRRHACARRSWRSTATCSTRRGGRTCSRASPAASRRRCSPTPRPARFRPPARTAAG